MGNWDFPSAFPLWGQSQLEWDKRFAESQCQGNDCWGTDFPKGRFDTCNRPSQTCSAHLSVTLAGMEKEKESCRSCLVQENCQQKRLWESPVNTKNGWIFCVTLLQAKVKHPLGSILRFLAVCTRQKKVSENCRRERRYRVTPILCRFCTAVGYC